VAAHLLSRLNLRPGRPDIGLFEVNRDTVTVW
jgi:hypothetical protein